MRRVTGLRAAIGCVALAAAVLVGWQSVVIAWRERHADNVLRIKPGDSVARFMSIQASGRSGVPLGTQVPEAVALAALKAEPLTPAAISAIAMHALEKDDSARALELLQLAQRFSRRDLAPQLALIEFNAIEGNVEAAMEQYDLALSSNERARDLLFPVLAQALPHRPVQNALAPLLAADRPWAKSFINYAISSPGSGALADMLAAMVRLPEGDDYRRLETQLFWQLDRNQDFATIRKAAPLLRGFGTGMLEQVAIERPSTDPYYGPIAWSLSSIPELYGSVAPDGRFRIEVAPSSRGIAAQKLLFLDPGAYTFHFELSEASSGARGVWELRCLARGRNDLIWRAEFPRNTGSSTAQWSVLPSCVAQRIVIEAIGSPDAIEAGILEVGGFSVTRR